MESKKLRLRKSEQEAQKGDNQMGYPPGTQSFPPPPITSWQRPDDGWSSYGPSVDALGKGKAMGKGNYTPYYSPFNNQKGAGKGGKGEKGGKAEGKGEGQAQF